MSVSILLIGAGGAFGRPLLRELVHQKKSFDVVAILSSDERKASNFEWAHKHGIIIRVGSFLEPSSYKGFTHVLCVVGNPVLCLQPAMISAAISAGVSHFYPSEWNSDISQRTLYNMRYFREKQVVRTYLADQAKRHPGFRYTLFITAIFTEWSITPFYGFDHHKHEVIAYGTADAQVGLTSIPDIAKYTVSSLLIPFKPTRGDFERTIRVTGTKTTHQGIVDAVSTAAGVQYKMQYRDPLEASKKEEQARNDGDTVEELRWSIRPLLASGYGVANGQTGSELDNNLFDFTPENMEATFQRVSETDILKV